MWGGDSQDLRTNKTERVQEAASEERLEKVNLQSSVFPQKSQQKCSVCSKQKKKKKLKLEELRE